MVYVRRGKTTSNNVRSCDTVRAGAFFPQAQLQVPQKEMRQHCRQHMVVPARICAHFIVVHPQLRFPFFEALFYGPTPATSPDKGAQGRARGGMTDGGRIGWLHPQGAFDHEPDGALRQTLLTQRHALAGKRLFDRPFGPFRDLAPIPARGGEARRQGRHGARGVVGGNHHPLRACFPLLSVDLLLGPWRLEPAAGVRRNRDQRRDPNTRVHGVEKVGAMAIEAIRHHIRERQEPLLRDGL